MDSFTYAPIGYVSSPFSDRDNMPKLYTDSGEVTATIEILPEYIDALMGVVPGMKLLMLFHFHRTTEHSLQVKKRGRGDLTGVFATRRSCRPNLIRQTQGSCSSLRLTQNL